MILPRTPAFLGMRTELKWTRADILTNDYISNRIGLTGEIEQIETSHPFPVGYFRLLEHHPPLFLKILPASESDSHKQSNKMLDWLIEQKVSVIKRFSNYPVTSDDEYEIFIYEYIPGNFAKPCSSYMLSLGSEMRKLHLALAKNAWRKEIRKASEDRMIILDKYLRQVRTLNLSVTVPDPVVRILKECPLDILLWLEKGRRQVVHGDINYGNVLFSDIDAKPVFLDFEHCWVSWFAPVIELSFVLQRFVLIHGLDLDVYPMAQALLHGYTNSEYGIYEESSQLEMTLKSLSVRNLLLLLIKNEYDQFSVSPLEWEKFVILYNLAEQQSHLLKTISEIP